VQTTSNKHDQIVKSKLAASETIFAWPDQTGVQSAFPFHQAKHLDIGLSGILCIDGSAWSTLPKS
jgi:hypothetical protein